MALVYCSCRRHRFPPEIFTRTVWLKKYYRSVELLFLARLFNDGAMISVWNRHTGYRANNQVGVIWGSKLPPSFAETGTDDAGPQISRRTATICQRLLCSAQRDVGIHRSQVFVIVGCWLIKRCFETTAIGVISTKKSS